MAIDTSSEANVVRDVVPRLSKEKREDIRRVFSEAFVGGYDEDLGEWVNVGAEGRGFGSVDELAEWFHARVMSYRRHWCS